MSPTPPLCRYLLHDRDTKITISFLSHYQVRRGQTLPLPARQSLKSTGPAQSGQVGEDEECLRLEDASFWL